MQIVIDIPDGYVGVVMSNQRMEGSAMDKLIRQAIIDGTPLPKGHGELIDKNVVLDMMNHGILEEYITVMGGVIPADK